MILATDTEHTALFVAQVIIPLLTIAFSGLFSAYLTHRLSATRADREFRLKRLEELFTALERFMTNYVALMMPLVPVMRGALPYAAAQELIAKHQDPKGDNHLRIVEMLIRIYFPELRGEYDALIAVRDRIAEDFYSPFVARAGRRESLSQLLPGFLEALMEFNRISEVLKEQIFVVAEKNRPRGLLGSLRGLFAEQINW